MGIKLLWTGLVFIVTTPVVSIPAAATVGVVLMLLGLVLMWLDR